MSTLIERKLWQYPVPVLTKSELANLIDGSPDSQYGRIKRAIRAKQLVQIKRGLYCLGERLAKQRAHPFEVAQKIYGPSYISLESALSYHRLIPEAVTTITSVTTKRKKNFETGLGSFIYLSLPVKNFFIEVDHVIDDGYQYFMATPWKALLDYLFCYKKKWKTLDPVVESLRIDTDELPMISCKNLQVLQDFYSTNRMTTFIKNIPKEFIHEH